MTITTSDLRRLVPIRPRVAFALAVAERVVPALAQNTEAFRIAQKALRAAWGWEEGEGKHAIGLYEDEVEGLAVQGSLVKSKEASAAMCAVTAAFYYAIWHAFGQDLSNGEVYAGDVPNDMADVTEDVIEEVCSYATQTSLCDSHWIDSLNQRLVADFRAENAEEFGPVVPRQYFG